MTPNPRTIFRSEDEPVAGGEDGYEVALAYGSDGAVESVAIMDHDMNDILELPPVEARRIALAILAALPDPTVLRH